MPILWRRMSMSSAAFAFSRSLPSSSTLPAVGSISLERQRSNVDLPEPDRPMTMKISPWRTLSEASRTAPTRPAAASSAGVAIPLRAARNSAGLRAEYLPDAATGELYRPCRESVEHFDSARIGTRHAALPRHQVLSQSGGAHLRPTVCGDYCAQAFHFASFASIQAAATSSIVLPSRSTSPLSLFSSAASIV